VFLVVSDTEMPHGAQAIGRALDILTAFTFKEPELTISDLTNKLSLPRTTIYRLISALEAKRFVDYNRETGKCRLGVALAQAGEIYLSQLDIRQVASGYMDDLADKYRQTVLLGILEDKRIVYIDKRESSRSLRVSSRILESRPLSYGGLARVILSQYEPSEIRELVPSSLLHRRTPKTITDYDKFLESIETVRKNGYYLEIEEVNEGVYSVAAPISKQTGEIIGALGVVGPTIHMASDLDKGLIDEVIKTAQMISERLGCV
jgi:IclR family KDG regulon transcriptional repressor